MRASWLLATVPLFVLGTSARTQNTIVSPTGATNVEGSFANIFPFADTRVRRYQQIHGDVGGSPKIITKISFRPDAANVTLTGTRAIDMELFMGLARPVSQTSFFFAQNYIGTPNTRIARKMVNMGPLGTVTLPGPNPFTTTMDLVLDSPFVYAGTTALIWEAVIYSDVATGSFGNIDADSSSSTAGGTSITGPGCGAMVHLASYTDRAGTLLINFQVTAGPANAPTLLAIGSTNPNSSITGLCSNLYTNLVAIIPIGVTNASGAITADMTGASTFVLPNTLPGAGLFTQVHAIDPSQPGIPIANSNGLAGVVPQVNATKLADLARIFNNVGGTTAVEATFFATSTIGNGLVTQFTY